MTLTEGELEARCQRCTRSFRYIPVRVGGLVVARKTTCADCVKAEEREVSEQEAELARKAREAAQAERESQVLELLNRITGNAAAHRHMTLDAFDASESGPKPLDRAREFVREILASPDPYTPVRGLYFHGTTGPGKTHLVLAIVRALISDVAFDPRSIVFDRADELILRIQATYSSRKDVFEAVLDRRVSARLWVLDDLGTERPTDDAARHLTMLLANRELKPTLVTSNFDPATLAKRFQEFGRAESRFGPRYFRVLEVRGRDRRFDSPRNVSGSAA